MKNPDVSRRGFVSMLAAAFAAPRAAWPLGEWGAPARAQSFDPWLEIDPAALHHNAAEIARLAAGRPVLAVVKNNAYGLGLTTVGPLLAALPPVWGLAVVKANEAMALRDAGVRKPILLMGPFDDGEARALAARDVRFGVFTDDAGDRLASLARRAERPIAVHPDIDTGMSRVGMPFRRALAWLDGLARRPELRIEGTFTTFVEDDRVDAEQLDRFLRLTAEARGRGIDLGRLHAASTHALFFRPAAFLDMVRPGLALYGAYPAGAHGLGAAGLRPVFRLRARVARVERIETGDGVSYGRNYVASQPTWIATLPVGHADGYPRSAVNGCEVLIGGRPYPVIGAVSASHTIVELGAGPAVAVGDEATLIGADQAAVHPNTVAARAGVSVYDVLMHLSAALTKRIAGA